MIIFVSNNLARLEQSKLLEETPDLKNVFNQPSCFSEAALKHFRT